MYLKICILDIKNDKEDNFSNSSVGLNRQVFAFMYSDGKLQHETEIFWLKSKISVCRVNKIEDKMKTC